MEFRDISRVSEAIPAKRIHVNPYCQRRNFSPLNVLFSKVALISQSVFQLGASNNVEMAKTSLHTHTAVARLPVLVLVDRTLHEASAVYGRPQDWMLKLLKLSHPVNKRYMKKRIHPVNN